MVVAEAEAEAAVAGRRSIPRLLRTTVGLFDRPSSLLHDSAPPQGRPLMTKTLYVGNLAPEISEDRLTSLLPTA